ncbi:MAG: SGNH/GDSL hydrolase family protein, partial [Ignavibacteriales bacterium]|nr:SGNH/GDSL hydrolase family protein [Ignavibacteriales bacterium]
YALTPPPQTLRIALFGDSFIHGDEVAFSATLGAYLEKEISEIQSETLNFGISGYGTDQAVLMYEKRGQAYHPHVVLLGFLTEHIARNINRFRRFYIPELETPFLSKPRFLLDSSGSLSLASPLCYSPQEVLVLIQKNDLKLLTQDEYFYFPECYTPAWTDFSLFLRELRTRFVKKRIKAFYRPKNLFQNPEVTEISFQILKRFCSEAQKAQAFPLIVTFHFLQDFEKWKEEGPYWKNFVQRCQEQDLPILDIGSLLAQDPHFLKNPKAHFLPQGHYHPKLTERVAQEIKNTLYKNSQFLQKLRALNSFKKD